MIEKNNGFLVLRLKSGLYERSSLMEAFEELRKKSEASIEEGKYFTIRIKESADAEKFGYEFLNYVLRLMKSKGVA